MRKVGRCARGKVTDRKYKSSEKQGISFEKRDVIEEMFKERLTNEEQDNFGESCNRFKRLNDLLRYAIHNIVRQEGAKPKRMREEDDSVSSAKRHKTNDSLHPNEMNNIY